MIQVREINPEEVDLLIEHLYRHFQEPGIGGIIAQPFSENEPFNGADFKLRVLKRWATTPGISNWEKTWVLVDGNKIVGHIELAGTNKPVIAHRARLGLGIETAYRSSGFGKKLLASALEWARQQAFVGWVDLDVFAHNTAAINLYKQFGFTVVGHTPDRIRVAGQSIDDFHMVLSLSRENSTLLSQTKVEPINIENLEYLEMNTKTEKLSHSAILTEKTDFQKLFVHHEIIPPGRRSSRPHFHSHTEEMFFVLEGKPSISYGEKTFQANPGDFIAFPPGERQLHCVINQTDKAVRVLGICGDSPLDQTHYEVKD